MLDSEFVSHVRRDMLRFAQLQLRDATLAEDAVQETFAAALAAQNQFAGRAALKTWVFGILRNKIIDILRQQRRTTNFSALAEDELEMDEVFDSLFKANEHWSSACRPTRWRDPDESLQDRQFWDVFEVCLDHLPENTARVFMMREFLEFETSEVCAELEITTNNCNVILHRARNGLRRCLENGWFGSGERTSQ